MITCVRVLVDYPQNKRPVVALETKLDDTFGGLEEGDVIMQAVEHAERICFSLSGNQDNLLATVKVEISVEHPR